MAKCYMNDTCIILVLSSVQLISTIVQGNNFSILYSYRLSSNLHKIVQYNTPRVVT